MPRLRPRVRSTCLQTVSPSAARAMKARPTGFPLSSLSGPATPVTATARSLPHTFRHPSAMARATGSDTAPYSSSSWWGTPRTLSFTALV